MGVFPKNKGIFLKMGCSQDEIDALLGLVQEYSNDIGMQFGMDKLDGGSPLSKGRKK